jgi:tetratricopeptide (TPR) repeat protein
VDTAVEHTPGAAEIRQAEYFISRAGPDAHWAIKIAQILIDAGHRVIIQDKDIVNTSFMAAMHDALRSGARTIALLSTDYLQRDHCAAEWQATIADDPLNRESRLIVFRIGNCAPTGLLKSLAYVDLVPLAGQDAALADVVVGAARARPGDALPEVVAQYWQAARPLLHHDIRETPSFTGRGGAIADIDVALKHGAVAAITQPVAIHGLGGVGKSTLARQYAFETGKYDIFSGIWWLAAEKDKATGAFAGVEADLLNLRAMLYPTARPPEDRTAAARAMLDHIANAGYARPWLIVYDNVDDMAVLRHWPPPANARVLVTTRLTTFRQDEVMPIEIGAWSITDAVSYLRRESGRTLSDDDAAAIAEAVGRLPLALSHAAAYLREMPAVAPSRYVARLTAHMANPPPGMAEAKTVFATFQEAIAQAEAFVPGAAAILSLAAFYAPDNIPLELFEQAAEHYPAPLRDIIADSDRRDEALSALARFSLVDLDLDAATVSVHRLVQMAAAAGLPADARAEWLTAAVVVCRHAIPGADFQHWRALERLVPHARHVAALAPDDVGEPLGYLLNAIAYYLDAVAAYAEAEPLYERSLRIREAALGPDHPSVGTALNNLAELYRVQGKYDLAEPLYERVNTIFEVALGPDHPDVGMSCGNLAGLYEATGRLEDAEPLRERELAIMENALPEGHPNIGTALSNLAGLYDAQGKYDLAEPLYERVNTIFEVALGPDHPDVGTSLNNLAGLYSTQGKYDRAEPFYERALRIGEAALGPDHPNTAITVWNMADLFYNMDRFDEALPLARRANGSLQKALGPDHPHTVSSAQTLANIEAAIANRDG